MGKTYPALDVRCEDTGILLATVDDCSPTAVEERRDAVRVFFSRSADRDAARRVLASGYSAAVVDVPDEDWARRSQENLHPIAIGRLTIFPNPESRIPDPCSIAIPPSMAFGTGHHVTTQLCLEALQAIDLANSTVLDVGTGSGVLSIAAVRLGAVRALGIDVDDDAICAARENLTFNPEVVPRVSFEVNDVSSCSTLGFVPDVLTANLTGALLARSASTLQDAVRPGGTLILSGLQIDERDGVERAFTAATTTWERTADTWVALMMKKS